MVDNDGGSHSVEQDFTIVDTAPKLSITRGVTKTGNYFEVTLTIANDASAIYAASVDYVIDHYKGFQAASKETSQYKVIPIYDRQTGKSTVRIDFLGGQGCIHINPGSQYQVTYELVPVLYEGNTVRHVGQYDLKLKLLDEAEAEYPIGIHLLTNASANAIDDADYVIVTNPDRLSTHAYDIWTTWNSPNDVLAEMAHLAVLRNGVLGYLATADDETVLDALVSTNGGWTQQLHPDFAAPGLGYMLIVGESDVVPAWRSDALNIDLSDHPYSVRLWPVTGSSTDIEVPSLIVGRVPGNDCDDLVKPLQTSIRVAEGETGYGIDRSEALVYSGMVEDRFFNNASDLAPMADAQLGTVNLFHQREYVISYTIPPIAWDVEPHDRIGAGNLFGYIKDYIAYANISDEEIIVTDWDGNWVVGGQFSVPGLQAGDQMAIGDVDGDGLEEIVVGLGQTGDIWVFEGDGTVVSSFFASFDPYDGLTTGDTDDDGEEEIIRAGVSAANNLRVYDSSGGLEHLLTVEYGAHYGLAAGETTGGAPARIFVIRPDTSAEDKGEIKVYAIQAGALVELSSHERRFREGGSILTANVLGQSDDEVLVGDDENVHGKYDSLYVLGEWGGSVAEETPRVFVDAYFGLGAGDLDGDGDEDIIIANPQSDQIEVLDVSFATTMYNDVTPTLPGTDLVVYRGHGHPGYMGVLHTGRATPDFGNSNPVVFAPTCLAGFYEPDPTINWNSDFGMAEWSFEGGAGVYAGATEVSYPDPNFAGVSHFVQNWDADDDVGYTFLSTEWEVGFVGGNDYWVWEYNLYGDPKYGAFAPLSSQGSEARGRLLSRSTTARTPAGALGVAVPDYEVSTTDDEFDVVSLPGGASIDLPGEYRVLVWPVQLSYPVGTQVTDVALASRSGEVLTTGLDITRTSILTDGATGAPAGVSGLSAPAEEDPTDYVPSLDQTFEWLVMKNPDGSSELLIRVYPFYYSPATTNVKFYQDYTFDITTIANTVSIDTLVTERAVYSQGQTITATLGITNPGSAQDVIVAAEVLDAFGDPVEGLLLRNLHGLEGEATFAFAWNSAGAPDGDYRIAVTLSNADDQVLEALATPVRLGVRQLALNVTATPGQVTPGQDVEIVLTCENIGSVPITGTLVIELRSTAGLSSTEQLHEAFDGLPAGATEAVTTTWSTAEDDLGLFTVLAYVLYDAKATTADPVEVQVGERLFVPIVLRQ